MIIVLLLVILALVISQWILSSRMNQRLKVLEGADVRSKSTVMTVESVPVRPLVTASRR